MISAAHIELLQLTLFSELKESGSITELKSCSGGSINQTYFFKYADRLFFLKHNSHKEFPEMFKKESEGLMELRKCKALVVPEAIAHLVIENEQYLILNKLESALNDSTFFETLGVGLAQLHSISSEKFGYSQDNYIGSLIQRNKRTDNWSDFFYESRLEPLIKWCYDKRYLSGVHIKSLETMYKRFDEIFPKETPSLLHGDLWSGNVMNTVYGPAVYDPAVYYGHREMDLAMTRLFGGFAPEFYSAYNAVNPLQKDYEKRTEICNLYPLLVHVKLFGTSYLNDVIVTLKQF